jgi:hypothetical protein
MKNIPCAYLFCAAALLGLPLVPVSASVATDGEIPAASVKQTDANKDNPSDESAKAVAPAEKGKQPNAREAKHAADLARYDVNKDGKLEADERAAKKADTEKARAEKKAAREEKRAEKTAAAEEKKLARYDRNKDGKLDESELAAANADEDRRKAAAAKRKASQEGKKPVAETAGNEGKAPDHE